MAAVLKAADSTSVKEKPRVAASAKDRRLPEGEGGDERVRAWRWGVGVRLTDRQVGHEKVAVRARA